MGARGPLPKPAALRQRRNKATTKATLPSLAEAARRRVPAMPKRAGAWHRETVAWWRSAWRSPMASEWIEPDVRGGMYLLLDLYELRWSDEVRSDAAQLDRVSKAIQLREQELGLTPLSRRRLQWEVEKGEQAAERTGARRQTKRATKAAKDPRARLKIA